MSLKLMTSYNVTTGIVQFADGTRKQFKKESIVMIDKLIYMLASRDSNFDALDLTEDVGVDIAFKLLSSE